MGKGGTTMTLSSFWPSPSFWADVIVFLHVCYVGFVALAVPAILIGGLMKADWVRNSWFRNIHLLMIALVVVESLTGFTCPLTTWENQLRIAAGEQGYERSFVGEMLRSVLFYDCRPAIFTISYTIFGTLVAGLYLVFPPRWLMRRKERRIEGRKQKAESGEHRA
jgi:general stress protein CsbA